MELWCTPFVKSSPAVQAMVRLLEDVGCKVSPRALSTDEDWDRHIKPTSMVVWQEIDNVAWRVKALNAGIYEIVGPWMDQKEAFARLLRCSAKL